MVEGREQSAVHRLSDNVKVPVKECYGVIAEIDISIGDFVDLHQQFIELCMFCQFIERFSGVLFNKCLGEIVEVLFQAWEVGQGTRLLKEVQPILCLEADDRAQEIISGGRQAIW